MSPLPAIPIQFTEASSLPVTTSVTHWCDESMFSSDLYPCPPSRREKEGRETTPFKFKQ